MKLQVRILPPQNSSPEASYDPQSQAVQATFVVSVAVDETFGSLLEKVRKRNDSRLAKGSDEVGRIVGLQNVKRKNLELSEVVSRIYQVDAGRDERVVYAVRMQMSERKGRKRNFGQEEAEEQRAVKKRKIEEEKRSEVVENTPREEHLEPKLQEDYADLKRTHRYRAGEEVILVPDSQNSLPTPRSGSHGSEAPTSAQRQLSPRAPARDQSRGVGRLHSSQRLRTKRAMEEEDSIEENETSDDEYGTRKASYHSAAPARKTPNKSFQRALGSATPTARMATRVRMKATPKNGRASSTRTPTVTGVNWTVAEDALLLKSIQDRLSVRETLQKYNIRKSIAAARSRRLLLQRQFPDGMSISLPGPTSDPPGPSSSPSEAQSYVHPQVGHTDDSDMLKRAIAAGYDPDEIRALYFPQELQTVVHAKFAQALPDAISKERKKEDWPQDSIVMTGWKDEHNLKLRRCLQEKLDVRDAHKRYFFDWNFRMIRKKIAAYKKQILGEDHDQTELDHTRIVASSAQKRDTLRSKSKVRPPVRQNVDTAGGNLDKQAAIQSAVGEKGKARNNGADAAGNDPEPVVKALSKTSGRADTAQASRIHSALGGTSLTGRDGNPESVVTIDRKGSLIQEASNTRKQAASLGRRKALEALRRKQLRGADAAQDKGADIERCAAYTSSTDSTEDNVADTEENVDHDTSDPDDVQSTSSGKGCMTDLLSVDLGDALPTMGTSHHTRGHKNAFAMLNDDTASEGRHSSSTQNDVDVQEETDQADVATVVSDSDSADTSVWQQQASAQLRDSSSVSPEPLDKSTTQLDDPKSCDRRRQISPHVQSAQSETKLRTIVRSNFSLRPDDRPSSQLVQELELTSANSTADMLQDGASAKHPASLIPGKAQLTPKPSLESHVDYNATDLASPESSVDSSASSHDDMPVEEAQAGEGSPEFMMLLSTSSQLKKYGSKSPRTPASLLASPSKAFRPEKLRAAVQEAENITSDRSLPYGGSRSAVMSGDSPIGMEKNTKGKLQRISSRHTHVSDALRRRSIVKDIQPSSETVPTLDSAKLQMEEATLPSLKCNLTSDGHAVEVVSIRPQSTSSASQPAKSFRDIETGGTHFDEWTDHGLPQIDGRRSVGLSTSSKESSPLIHGDLKDAVELAARSESIPCGARSAGPEISNTGLAKAYRSAREPSEESVEDEISRNRQNTSDEEGFSDAIDSDNAGADYASSTSEDDVDVIRDREVVEVHSDDVSSVDAWSEKDIKAADEGTPAHNDNTEAVPEKDGRLWPDALKAADGGMGDTKAVIGHVLQGPPVQRGGRQISEARSTSIGKDDQGSDSRGFHAMPTDDPASSISDDDATTDATNDSEEVDDVDATGTPDSDSEMDSGEVSGEDIANEARDNDLDEIHQNTPSILHKQGPITAGVEHSPNDNLDRSLGSPSKAHRNALWPKKSSAVEPEVFSSSDDTASSDEASSESDSEGSDDKSSNDEDQEHDEVLDSRGRHLSAAHSQVKALSNGRSRGEHSQKERAEGHTADSPEANDTTERPLRSTIRSGIMLPQGQKDRSVGQTTDAPFQKPVVGKPEPTPKSRAPQAAVRSGRSSMSADPPASTAPVIGNRNDASLSLKDSLPKSSPVTKTMESLPRERFRLSNLIGKATSIPASSQNVRKGQPVKRYLPAMDDDDEDDDSDDSSSI